MSMRTSTVFSASDSFRGHNVLACRRTSAKILVASPSGCQGPSDPLVQQCKNRWRLEAQGSRCFVKWDLVKYVQFQQFQIFQYSSVFISIHQYSRNQCSYLSTTAGAWEHPVDPVDQLSALVLAHSKPTGLVPGIPSDRHRWSAGQDSLRGGKPRSSDLGSGQLFSAFHIADSIGFHAPVDLNLETKGYLKYPYIYIYIYIYKSICERASLPRYGLWLRAPAPTNRRNHYKMSENYRGNLSVPWHDTDLHMTSNTKHNMSWT